MVKIEGFQERVAQATTLLAKGRVESVVGLTMRVTLAGARMGDLVTVHRRGFPLRGEIVGFDGGQAVVMPLGDLGGVGADDPVEALGTPLEVSVSEDLLGRVLNGYGEPIDGSGPLGKGELYPVDANPPSALGRRAITEPLPTGIRAIDGLLTLGEGQRIGLFAGSGVGKSTLLGSIARGTAADVVVVALVGERGREVGEFLEGNLGPTGLDKSVVVVATSDAPAVERLRAAQVATSIAEFFRDRARRVMLLVDSVTRIARAQREIGLAAGEPPARRGYPPSVFAMLPRLLERAGQGARGSITAFYTVLVEGGDLEEPIADEVRGILDGHIVLDRGIAMRGRYPAIDVLSSLSRVMDRVVSPSHAKGAAKLREILATYESKRDLISLGAYKRGADSGVDAAVERMPQAEAFLRQTPQALEDFEATRSALEHLTGSRR